MYWNGYCGPGAGSWFFHGPILMMLLFIAGLSFLYFISSQRRKDSAVEVNDSAVEILRNRYANGEIDESEYLFRKEKLDL